MNRDFVVFDKVKKIYRVGEVEIEALVDARFTVNKGELAVVVGESGAGKTTLLNILGGMETLTSGHAWLDGTEISGMNRRHFRHDGKTSQQNRCQRCCSCRETQRAN